MTGQTGEGTIAVAEAGGAMQIQRLVAHIPGVAPIRAVIQVASLPMATPAQNIDLGRAQPFGILNPARAARFRVRPPGTMAGLAVDAGFAGLHPKSSRQRNRTCRVASKAAQRRRHRIESAIDPIQRGGVSGRHAEGFRRRVITQAVFNQAVFAVWLTQVMAFAPAPNAHCARLPGPGSVGRARLKAWTWPVFDCDSNCEGWQVRHTEPPTYADAASWPINGAAQMAKPAIAENRNKSIGKQ